MSWAGLLVTLIGTALVAGLILGPILRQDVSAKLSSEADALQRRREALRLEYNAVLQTLRDLDEDHATGKLSSQEYQAEKNRWNAEGVRLLRERDEARHAAAKLQKSQGN
jgi:hypothetical protein